MDAYNVAFRVPNLLRDLFAEGAMSAAFVPTFTRDLATNGKASAFRLGANVVNALLVITGVLVLLGMFFADPLVALLRRRIRQRAGQARADGDADAHHAAVPDVRGAGRRVHGDAERAGALLHSRAVAGDVQRGERSLCAVGLVPFMPALGLPPVAGIAIGTVLGGVAQWAIQWPLLRREGFRYTPRLDWSDPGLRRVLLLMGPGTIGLAATQVNVFVNTLLATRQATGAVSWLNYAFRLMYLPIGLFGVSIATATTPAIARLAAQSDQGAVRKTIADGLTLMLMLNVPATVGLAVLAQPIVQLMYERGAFSRPTRWPRRRRCSSTPSGCWDTRWCASPRPRSTRSSRTGFRSRSASSRCS